MRALAFILCACAFSAPLHANSGVLRNDGPIQISVLSKHLKSLRAGDLDRIEIILPEGSSCTDGGSGARLTVLKIEIQFRNSEYRALADTTPLGGRFSLSAEGAPELSAVVRLKNETRRYPLPLRIELAAGEMTVIASEDPIRYARDSAAAEYGVQPRAHEEAAQALALLILARADRARSHPLHGDAHVCDLTHCQVYRGRTGDEAADTAPPPWRIDSAKLACEPVFHARCGGATMGDGVFSLTTARSGGVRDRLIGEGTYLCRDRQSAWTARLTGEEITALATGERREMGRLTDIVYDRKARAIELHSEGESRSLAPEDFRLRVNRVRGWNFLKSNNYEITKTGEPGSLVFDFRGWGLGHGAGLCQHGALALAARGYSRYEILGHYFPGIIFSAGTPDPDPGSPYISYVRFSLLTGELIGASHAQILSRRVAPGSAFKILVSLYLAVRRPDLARDYRYMCTGAPENPAMPDRCWKPGGHGDTALPRALAGSCNLYFASLYAHIDRADFMTYIASLSRQLGISLTLPEIADEKEFARLLCGLDYRAKLGIRDLIKVAMLVAPSTGTIRAVEDLRRQVPVPYMELILAALAETMRTGTAAGHSEPYGSARENTEPLRADAGAAEEDTFACPEPGFPCWGKTSTVMAGTNRYLSYGLFLGGDRETGLIVIIARGNGHLAARWALRILRRTRPER